MDQNEGMAQARERERLDAEFRAECGTVCPRHTAHPVDRAFANALASAFVQSVGAGSASSTKE